MQQRYFSQLDSFHIPKDAAREAFQDLNSHYSANGRYYHNMDHVADVLDVIDDLEELAQDPVIIKLSAWYHDIILDTREKDNEIQSAAFAKRTLVSLGLPVMSAERVSEIILATEKHFAPNGDIDCQILLDADLASLGAGEETFDRHSQALRQEFAWIPDQEYHISRARFLSGILERERIYLTGPAYEKYEKQARINLTRAISELS